MSSHFINFLSQTTERLRVHKAVVGDEGGWEGSQCTVGDVGAGYAL